MDIITTLFISIIGSIIAYYICKWLDRDRRQPTWRVKPFSVHNGNRKSHEVQLVAFSYMDINITTLLCFAYPQYNTTYLFCKALSSNNLFNYYLSITSSFKKSPVLYMLRHFSEEHSSACSLCHLRLKQRLLSLHLIQEMYDSSVLHYWYPARPAFRHIPASQ